MSGFFPDDYKEPPKASNYMKLEDGVNKFRVLSPFVFGWEYWLEQDGKRTPFRVKKFEDVPQELRTAKENKDRPKFFWAMLVWNYDAEQAQILQINQASIRDAITGLDNDPDWGDVRQYDLSITKSGKELETKYQVNPKPKAAFDTKGKDIPAVNLEALFVGDDPFIVLDSEGEKQISDELGFASFDPSELKE